jgi:dTDP-4-amino-4,6-dideoxygalactose transaminase
MTERKRIHLCLAKMSDTGAEQRYIQEAFETHWVAPLGPNVDAFEADLEAFVNTAGMTCFPESALRQAQGPQVLNKHVAALSSCTAALHLALLLLGVGRDDEVLCQTFTFCASTNPVTYCGARPVFVDSDKETWNMSPELLEEAIKDRMAKTGLKPKAIIVVDLYGMPAQWEAIEEISRRYEIPVIEDAANAMGSYYKGKPCGTFGTLATFSFNGNKIITTSGGGAIICPDEATKQRAIFLATQARENALHYQHEVIGYNYRMSNICAGIGRGQMTVLQDHIDHHKHVHQLYVELLADVLGVRVHNQQGLFYTPHAALDAASHEIPGQARNEGRFMPVFDSNYWLTTVTFGKKVDVTALCKALNASGIEARPLWKPMHLQPVYKDAPAYTNGVSETLFRTGLCLPSGPWVSDEDVGYIVDCIRKNII